MNYSEFVLMYVLARASQVSKNLDIQGVLMDADSAWIHAHREEVRNGRPT